MDDLGMDVYGVGMFTEHISSGLDVSKPFIPADSLRKRCLAVQPTNVWLIIATISWGWHIHQIYIYIYIWMYHPANSWHSFGAKLSSHSHAQPIHVTHEMLGIHCGQLNVFGTNDGQSWFVDLWSKICTGVRS